MLPRPLIVGIGLVLLYETLKSKRPDPAAAPSSDLGYAPVFSNNGAPPIQTVIDHNPMGEPPSGPPLSSGDTEDAVTMANDVQTDLMANGPNYDRVALAAFQRKARLTVDGLYGGRTAGAVEYFLKMSAYPPIFDPKPAIPYKPPSGIG